MYKAIPCLICVLSDGIQAWGISNDVDVCSNVTHFEEYPDVAPLARGKIK